MKSYVKLRNILLPERHSANPPKITWSIVVVMDSCKSLLALSLVFIAKQG